MDLRSVKSGEGVAIATLRPSVEGGIFLTGFGVEPFVGRLAVIGIGLDDAERLTDGDLKILEQYIAADPSRPGVYIMKTNGWLARHESPTSGNNSYVAVNDGELREYTLNPASPMAEAAE